MMYFTSDLHLNHDKDFCYLPRGCSSTEEMNDKIISNLKATVTDDDELYILGDVILTKMDQELLAKIPGKVTVIRGNHDSDPKIDIYKSLGWDVKDAQYIKYKKITFFLCHYPCHVMETPKPFKLSIFCLHGHTHSKNIYSQVPNNYNVAVDANDCRPVSIQEIVSSLRKHCEVNNNV